jgi:hypothetical protein
LEIKLKYKVTDNSGNPLTTKGTKEMHKGHEGEEWGKGRRGEGEEGR